MFKIELETDDYYFTDEYAAIRWYGRCVSLGRSWIFPVISVVEPGRGKNFPAESGNANVRRVSD